MSAPGALPTLTDARVERRCCQTPWGIKIEIWRLVQTRTLPAESACLPFFLVFEEAAERGATPHDANDQADTLEGPGDDDVTGEKPASAYAAGQTERKS